MYKIIKKDSGFVIKKKVWYGWKSIKYKDYGAIENRVKIFKTEEKAQWVINNRLPK